jgi:signal transduction histidine kinase
MSRLNNQFRASLQPQTSQSAKKIFIFHGVSIAIAMVLFLGVIVGLRPIRKLIEEVRKMGSGDLDAVIPIHRGDEIGQLAAEFNQMAKSLKQHQQALVRAERLAAVGKMAANVAHEIRNPLNAIALTVELTEDAISDGDMDSTGPLLQTVRKEVERLTEVTESYLRFSALPSPRKEPVDLAGIARDLVAFQSEVAKRSGVSLTVHCPEAIWADADPDQIRQALLNLIRNGIEATGENGNLKVEVQVVTTDEKRFCRFHVIDDGPGVAEDVASQMFDPFFSTKKHGTGLGLALVSKVADAHGGQLTHRGVGPGNTGAHFVLEIAAQT